MALTDLKVVMLLRGAMSQADLAGGACLASHPTPRIEPRRVIHPDPRFAPRPVIHPTPRFAPRPVIHPTPRVETAPQPEKPEELTRLKSPIEPPWRQLPWEQPLPPRPVIKPIVQKTDVPRKGTVLDLFI